MATPPAKKKKKNKKKQKKKTLALDVMTLKFIAFCELNVSDSAIAISACFIGSFCSVLPDNESFSCLQMYIEPANPSVTFCIHTLIRLYVMSGG